MANEITNTEATVLIPEIWQPRMLEARYSQAKMLPRILDVSGQVAKMGDILHIPIEPVVSVNDVTQATGAVTNQALTPTEQQLTVNKWKEATIDVVDMTNYQSELDLIAAFVPSFGKAIGEQQDTDILALYSDVTTNVLGGSDATIDEDMVLAAISKFLDLKIPTENPNDMTFMFHTSVWKQLKKIARYNDANLTGMSQGGVVRQSIPDLYGIPTYFTALVPTSSLAKQNLLFHRQAFACGTQKNFRVEFLARTKKSTPVSGDILYGVKTVRQNHACLLKSDSTK